MKSFGEYIDEAISHEAGHILVGWAVGLRARGLDVEIAAIPGGAGITVRNFATLGFSPPDEEIPKLDSKVKAAYMLFISGGVTGNKFSGLKTACQGAGADRVELARLTKTSLEEIAEMAIGIIEKRRRAFRQLESLIRQRLTERIWSNRDVEFGRINLLTEADLEKLFGESTLAKDEQENPRR